MLWHSTIRPISSWRIRKEELAHQRQQAEHIENGLIGVWSCQESASSFRARYCAQVGYPQLQKYQTRCKHLYFYFDHADFGFMNIRLQTWFPYSLQICLNGRQWLRRRLEQQHIEFLAQGNKFLHISDYPEAQRLLHQQLDARFVALLNGFVPIVFPMAREVLGPHLSYYWTLWQNEWASDLIFDTSSTLAPIMDRLLRHAHMTGTSARVLRYLDRPLTMAGKPYARSKEDVVTRVLDFNEGLRVRHWVDHNSVKVYNEQNVLRIETTINNPGQFRVFRHKQRQSSETGFRSGSTDQQLSSKISRHFQLLRAHGIIRKLPRQNRYQLTTKGVQLTNMIHAFLAASTESLMKMAA